MFNPFAKPARITTPPLRRALIVDPHAERARALGEMIREFGQPEIWAAPTADKGLRLVGKVDPELIFCALADDEVDGAAFTRSLRRGDLACRKAPVILLAAGADPAVVLAGRDAGAHEVLRPPFTRKDLARRVEAALAPRGWVEAIDYVGPDRRRFNSAEFEGPGKRLADQAPPQSVRVGEALKIVAAALEAAERDPLQAVRALLAQTSELEAAAAEAADGRLAQANGELRRYLAETAGAPLDPAEARRCSEALLAYAGRKAA